MFLIKFNENNAIPTVTPICGYDMISSTRCPLLYGFPACFFMSWWLCHKPRPGVVMALVFFSICFLQKYSKHCWDRPSVTPVVMQWCMVITFVQPSRKSLSSFFVKSKLKNKLKLNRSFVLSSSSIIEWAYLIYFTFARKSKQIWKRYINYFCISFFFLQEKQLIVILFWDS